MKKNDKEKISSLHHEAQELKMGINEYVTAKTIITNVKKLLKETIEPSICSHCLMQETCRKYGRPQTCLKTGAYNELHGLLSHITIEEMAQLPDDHEEESI